MKAIVFALPLVAAALTAAAPAFAGNNRGAVLIVHTMPITQSTSCASFLGIQQNPQSAQPTSPAGHGEFSCVGVLASRVEPLDLVGIDFGIAYTNLNIISWMSCGSAQIATDGEAAPAWPSTGSGVSVIWVTPQRGETAVIGFFVAYVYGSASFSIAPHPSWGGPRLLDERSDFDDVQAGMAGFGGRQGSNPAPTAILPASWGNIKAQYRN